MSTHTHLAPQAHIATQALGTWHALLKNKDAAGLDMLLADEVVFYSPVVATPQRGRAITRAYLSAAMHVFGVDSFRYVREIVGANDAVLEFELSLNGIHINGVDLLRWNEAQQLTEFKVMLRPLKAVNLIHQKMADMLAAKAAQNT